MTKVKQRNWSVERFGEAVTNRAKRLGIKIRTGGIKEMYEKMASVNDAVSLLDISRSNSKKKQVKKAA